MMARSDAALLGQPNVAKPEGVQEVGRAGMALRATLVASVSLVLANCSQNSSKVDPRYGVAASPRVVAEGQPVPKGGGRFQTGKPYVVGGRTYVPQTAPIGYKAEGIASWYGSQFHGRLTANGEVFDSASLSAAHPTLPLPSYVRVTNATNGRSIVVRVNDRGPFHRGRLMDVSKKTAEMLGFRGTGMARIQVEYVGPASLEGSDDRKLLATYRENGRDAPIPREQLLASLRGPASPAAAPAPQQQPTAIRSAIAANEQQPTGLFGFLQPVSPRDQQHAEPVEHVSPAPAGPVMASLDSGASNVPPPVIVTSDGRPVQVAPAAEPAQAASAVPLPVPPPGRAYASAQPVIAYAPTNPVVQPPQAQSAPLALRPTINASAPAVQPSMPAPARAAEPVKPALRASAPVVVAPVSVKSAPVAVPPPAPKAAPMALKPVAAPIPAKPAMPAAAPAKPAPQQVHAPVAAPTQTGSTRPAAALEPKVAEAAPAPAVTVNSRISAGFAGLSSAPMASQGNHLIPPSSSAFARTQ